jgi:2,3-bisphosphoglycerate-dependent phosphoglycerate mutase
MTPPFRILLVRHAEPAHFERATGTAQRDGAGSDWNDRPLSPAGILAARELAVTLVTGRPTAIYSSPYLRARQTVEPVAKHLGFAIEIVDDLRERLLAPNLNDDWQIHIRRAWQDFDYVLAGGESSRQAQDRVLRVLDALRARHESGTIVVASHGNLIALALHAMANGIDHDFWKAMPLLAAYQLEWVEGHWRAHDPRLRLSPATGR